MDNDLHPSTPCLTGMTVPANIDLPAELMDQIIDEAWEAQQGSLGGSEGLISSLALASHAFRHRINVHRFATISFFARESTISDIDTFINLLESDIWTPDVGIVRHIRRLELLLGITAFLMSFMSPHPSIDNGSLIKVLDLVFCGPSPVSSRKEVYTLVLYGQTKLDAEWFHAGVPWKMINPKFVSYLEMLVSSCIGNVELWWFSFETLTFPKALAIKKLKLMSINFAEVHGLNDDAMQPGPYDQIEDLEVAHSNFFHVTHLTHASLGWRLAAVKTLSVHVVNDAMAKSISHHWLHWGLLQTLIVHIYNDQGLPKFEFEVAYKHLPSLKRLVLNLIFKGSNSERDWFAQRVLDTLGSDTPSIPELEISFRTDPRILERSPDIVRVDDIVKQDNCSRIDAFLERYCTAIAPSSTLTIRFDIKVSQVLPTEFDVSKFREEGLVNLLNVFPRLDSSSRQGSFDTVLRKRWQDRESKNVILHEGIFSVVYAPSPSAININTRTSTQ